MPGIDRKKVIGKSEDELDELTCCICQDIFDEPVVTQCCRQTYCKECINEWLITNNTCPNDRKPLSSQNLIPAPRIVINLLDKLIVKCEYSSNGCPFELNIEEMVKHSIECDYYSCNSCKTSKNLLSEKQKEIDLLRNQLKYNEIDLKDMEEKMRTLVITQSKCEENLIILARLDSSFEDMSAFGLTAGQKNFVVKLISDALIKNNSFGDVARFIKRNIIKHDMLKEFSWTTIVGMEFNASFVGKVKLCIKYFNGLKVIIIGNK